MDEQKDAGVEAILEHLIEHGANDLATVFARAFELAMRIERERFLGAGHYERTASRQGYANGTKPKRIDTSAGYRRRNAVAAPARAKRRNRGRAGTGSSAVRMSRSPGPRLAQHPLPGRACKHALSLL
jgi:hypothetical protein